MEFTYNKGFESRRSSFSGTLPDRQDSFN